jgi:hypothetical protein
MAAVVLALFYIMAMKLEAGHEWLPGCEIYSTLFQSAINRSSLSCVVETFNLHCISLKNMRQDAALLVTLVRPYICMGEIFDTNILNCPAMDALIAPMKFCVDSIP